MQSSRKLKLSRKTAATAGPSRRTPYARAAGKNSPKTPPTLKGKKNPPTSKISSNSKDQNTPSDKETKKHPPPIPSSKKTKELPASNEKISRKKLDFDNVKESDNAKEGKTASNINFPDLTDSAAIQSTWTVPQLKQMLTSVGATTDGVKADLASRVMEVAVVDNPGTLSRNELSHLSDLQVAFVLQQLDADLDASHEVRRQKLFEIFDDDSTADNHVKKSNLAKENKRAAKNSFSSSDDEELREPPRVNSRNSVESSDEEGASIHDQLRESMLEIEKLKAKIKAQNKKKQLVGVKKKFKNHPSSVEISDDSDHIGINSEDDIEKSRNESASSLKLMASSIASAITDGMAAANEGTSGAAAYAKIDRTHPALIDPRKHGNDAHKFGLLIKRMIDLDYNSAGLAGIAWKHSVKAKALEIQGLVHADASKNDYIEGESLFISLVNECISLALEHDKDAARYASHRVKQFGWWLEAFNTLKQDIRNSTRFWKTKSTTFRFQMEDLICTALGLGFSNTQLRTMKTSLKLRSDFLGGDSDDDVVSSSRATSSRVPEPFSRSKRVRWDEEEEEAPSSKQPRPKNTGKKVNSASDKTSTGKRCPVAKSIVGASTPGAQDCDATCPECNTEGHRRFECPATFAKEYPGKSIPGFDKRGNRISSQWDGDNLTSALKSQWLRLQALGYFTDPSFRKNPDVGPDFRK